MATAVLGRSVDWTLCPVKFRRVEPTRQANFNIIFSITEDFSSFHPIVQSPMVNGASTLTRAFPLYQGLR